MLKDLFQQSARMIASSIYLPKALRNVLPTTKDKSGRTVIDSKRLVRVHTVVTKLDFGHISACLIEHEEKVEIAKVDLASNNGQGFKIVSIKTKRLDQYHMVVSIIRYNI